MSREVSFTEWGSVDQVHARQMARDPDVKPLWLRVMFASMGWSNLIGHAEFARSGLAVVLQSNDPQTGVLSIPSDSQVDTAIRTAKTKGLVDPDSTRRCLVAPEWWDKAGGKGTRTCAEHAIYPRRDRHKKANRHRNGVTPTQILCQPDPLTCDDDTPSYDSALSQQPTTDQQSRRSA